MDLAEWIERHARLTPDKVAIRFPGGDVSYAALAGRVERWAGALAAAGVGRGDRAAYLGLNSPEVLALLFACARLGAMFLPLNWRLAPPEHRQVLADCKPTALLVEPAFTAHADAFRDDLRDVARVCLGPATEGWMARDDFLVRGGRAPPRDPRVGLEIPLLVSYTSGSTGKPKGVVLSQDALFWNAVHSADMHDLAARDVILTTLPLFHVGGLNNQTTPGLRAGCTVVLHPRFGVEETFDAIERERVTLTVLVPAQLDMMVASPRWPRADLSSLRMITTGSTHVPDRIIRAVHARGVPLVQVYGSTETCPIAVYQKAHEAERKAGSTGRPAPHCEVRVVDPSGQTRPAGASGEVLVRGPNVMLGYWNAPDATAAALLDGWFHTGDYGHWDADGYLWIDGRKKDLIISGGENVYPAEVENVLADCPEIVEAAVVGRSDPRWGEVVVAVVVPAPGSRLGEADVLRMFEGRIARYKHPKDVIFVERLPRSAVGKLRKEEIRRLVGGDASPGASARAAATPEKTEPAPWR
jgi:fatty-acyl-CoA synthase